MDLLENIRWEIQEKVLEFNHPKNKEKILLINSSQGTGKTITTLKAFLENEITFVYLGYGKHKIVHNIISNPNISKYNLFHLKGMNEYCENTLLRTVVDKNISVGETLCKKCVYKDKCEYLNQYEQLEDTNESWASVIHYASSIFIHTYDYEILVLDEHPLDGFVRKTIFNDIHLKGLKKIVEKITVESDLENAGPLNESYVAIISTIDALLKILQNVPKEGIAGKEFIEAFNDYLAVSQDVLYDITLLRRGYIGGKTVDVLKSHYKKFLYELFEKQPEDVWEDFKNIFYEILEIIKLWYEYKDTKEDINIPIFIKQNTGGRDEITLYRVTRKLPARPVIILDATGDPTVYEEAFQREVEVFNPVIHIDRNITQIMDGFYPRSSLKKDHSRKNPYKRDLESVKIWNKMGHIPLIVTHKPFTTISQENNKKYKGKYVGKSIERYLLDENGLKKCEFDDKGKMIKKGDYIIRHFEDMISANYPDIKKIYIIGTPWLSEDDALEQFSIWYAGEKPLSTERIENPDGKKFRYKDERFEAHMRPHRDHLLEHTVERIRFIFPDVEKEVILDSKMPIKFKTKKMGGKEYMKKIGATDDIRNMNVRCLQFIRDKGEVSFEEFYKKFRNIKGVKQIGGVQAIRDRLIKNKFVKMREVKQKYSIKKILSTTAKGDKYLSTIPKS